MLTNVRSTNVQLATALFKLRRMTFFWTFDLPWDHVIHILNFNHVQLEFSKCVLSNVVDFKRNLVSCFIKEMLRPPTVSQFCMMKRKYTGCRMHRKKVKISHATCSSRYNELSLENKSGFFHDVLTSRFLLARSSLLLRQAQPTSPIEYRAR